MNALGRAHHGREPNASRQAPRRTCASGVSACTIHAWSAPGRSEVLVSHVAGVGLTGEPFTGPPIDVGRLGVTLSAMLFVRTRGRDAFLQDEGFRSLRQA
jgi:hypothetical protein